MTTRNEHPGGYPAIPASSGASAVASVAKFEIHTVLIALRCWWKIALPLAVLLAAAGGSGVYYLFEPTYTAYRTVFIGERARQIIRSNEENAERFVNNQKQLMTSRYLLAPLAQRHDIRSTPELARERDLVLALSQLLRVKNEGQSEYYSLEFSSTSPEKAALVVNAVAEAYITLQKNNQAGQRDESIRALEQFRKTLEAQVGEADDRVDAIAKSMNVKLDDPLVRNRSQDGSDEDAAVRGIEQELFSVEMECIFMGADCKRLEEQAAQGTAVVSAAEIENALQIDPRLQQLGADLERLTQTIAGRQKAGNPAFLARDRGHQLLIEQQKQAADDLKSQTESRRKEFAEQRAAQLRTHQQLSLENKKAELAQLQAFRDQLRSKLGEADKNRKVVQTNTYELHKAIDEHKRAKDFYDTVANQLQSMKANDQVAGDRVYLLEAATPPIVPDEEIPFKKIGLLAGAAFCLPFGLAIAWEHFFRRVNSRQQLETSSALKVVGEITALPRRSRRHAKAQTTRELQLFEESVDGLRTYLSLVETLQGLRVLCVTSAISREGKTSVASQLAVSIAGATGEPTLLIDGDLRSPDIHRIFGVDLSPGLAEVLSGELSDDEAIETDFNDTLHLMTAGKLNSSPHRLLGSGEFKALLERLRGVYRYIVIDTPPLLAASEALILARAADAAILAARRDFSRLDQVTEAYARLSAASVSFAGVVLNGIPIRHYAYKYGSYGYRRRMATVD